MRNSPARKEEVGEADREHGKTWKMRKKKSEATGNERFLLLTKIHLFSLIHLAILPGQIG